MDTLCIKQDDPLDWRDQSQKMHEVYGQSDLNICVSRSLHDESLYTSRDPLILVNMEIPIQESPEILRNEATMRPLCHPIRDDPLATRGWAFQETLLATRNLYFGSEQLLYRCQEMTSREINGPVWDATVSLPADLSESHIEPDALLCHWLSVVTIYSLTQTTYEQDRLYAIEGVARLFADCWRRALSKSCPYITGMWEYGIIQQLCWHTKYDIPLQPMASKYRAPSWSWSVSSTTLALLATHIDMLIHAGRVRMPRASSVSTPKAGIRALSWRALRATELHALENQGLGPRWKEPNAHCGPISALSNSWGGLETEIDSWRSCLSMKTYSGHSCKLSWRARLRTAIGRMRS